MFFTDGKETDASWEGISEHKLVLAGEEEVKINISYVVMRGGTYELSR